MANGVLYVLGGVTALGPTGTNDAWASPITATGELSGWHPVASFSGNRRGAAAVEILGRLYLFGGTSVGPTSLSDVQSAALLPDGSLGAWESAGTLPSPRDAPGVVSWNGTAVLTGGFDGTAYYADTQVAAASSLGTLGAWTATSPISVARRAFGTAQGRSYAYVLGGHSSTQSALYTTVEYAKIGLTNGIAGNWAPTNPLPTGREDLAAVMWETCLYAVGGNDGNTDLADVLYARQMIDGTLGQFMAATPMPRPRSNHDVAVWKNRIYVAGGLDSTAGEAELNDVIWAQLNNDCSITSWNTASPPFNGPRWRHTLEVYNGFLYVIAGGPSVQAQGDVQFAPINADGSVGAWTPTTSLPLLRRSHASVAWNGFLYVLGGNTPNVLSDVLAAPFHADGTLGNWEWTNALPAPRYTEGALTANGLLFSIGGFDGAHDSAEVDYAPLITPQGRGTYTRLVDFGSEVTSLDTIAVGNPAVVQYAVAPENGVFSALTAIGTLNVGVNFSIDAGTVRYSYWQLSIDDLGADGSRRCHAGSGQHDSRFHVDVHAAHRHRRRQRSGRRHSCTRRRHRVDGRWFRCTGRRHGCGRRWWRERIRRWRQRVRRWRQRVRRWRQRVRRWRCSASVGGGSASVGWRQRVRRWRSRNGRWRHDEETVTHRLRVRLWLERARALAVRPARVAVRARLQILPESPDASGAGARGGSVADGCSASEEPVSGGRGAAVSQPRV